MISDRWCLIAIENEIDDLKQKAKENGKCVRCGKKTSRLYCSKVCCNSFYQLSLKEKARFDFQLMEKVDAYRAYSRKYAKQRLTKIRADPNLCAEHKAWRSVLGKKYRSEVRCDPERLNRRRIYDRNWKRERSLATQTIKANRFLENKDGND